MYLHLFHAGQVNVPDERGVGLAGVPLDFAGDAGVAQINERDAAGGAHRAHEFDGHFVRHIHHVQQDVFALLTRVE